MSTDLWPQPDDEARPAESGPAPRAPLPVIPVDELGLHIGREIGLSAWVTIGQREIDEFARLTRDDQWIHVDEERARRERGGTVAHGFLTLSLLSWLGRSMVFQLQGVTHAVNYGFDRLRFTGFVPSGARVRLRQTLKGVEPRSGGIAFTRHCIVEIEGQEKPALVADWVTLVYTRPAPGGDAGADPR